MRYIALFRGINVGGKNIVKMDALKRFFLDLGLKNVQTHIQSGNVVFETELEKGPLRRAICAGFAARFGFESEVMLRDREEMKTLVEGLPFSAAQVAAAESADPEVEHLYVYFLETMPEAAALEEISKGYAGPDALCAGKSELYFLCSQSIRNAKLAARILKAFGSATVRNWNTVRKLYAMLTSP